MKTINQRIQNSGGILLIAILFIGSLASLSIAVMTVVRSKSRQAYQTSGWQEALSAAESGIDVGLGELKKMIENPATAFTDATDWEYSANTTYSPKDFWEPSPGDPDYDSAVHQWKVSAGLPNAIFDSAAGRYRKTILGETINDPLYKIGMGGSRAKTVVIIDTTENLKDDSDEYWYRIRAIGIAEIPGGQITTGDGRATTTTTEGGTSVTTTSSRTMDNELRRLDLKMNHRTSEEVGYPQASRIVEAIAKPVSAFAKALHADGAINMNNQNIVVDSYDSRDPAKSVNGKWDESIAGENGDIATNGDLIDAGGAHIYGDASTNGGDVLGDQNVTGDITDDFYQEIFPVKAPTITATDDGDNSTYTATPGLPGLATAAGNDDDLDSNMTINATAAGVYMQVDSIDLTSKDLIIEGSGSVNSPTYITIVVTGDVKTSGNGSIELKDGVYLRLFVAGNMDITGNGFLHSGSPRQLQVYGTAPTTNPDGTPASAKTMKIAGNGAFHGSCYAPNYDLELKGGGSDDDSVCGAFVCKTVFMNGVTSVHYDEALEDSGLVTTYQVSTWFEDIR